MKRNKSFDKGNFPLYLIATPIGNLKEFYLVLKKKLIRLENITKKKLANILSPLSKQVRKLFICLMLVIQASLIRVIS